MNKYVSIILNGKDNATQAFTKVGASSNRLQKQIASLKMAFGGLIAGVGAVSLAKWSIKSVSDLEQVQTSFETMLGSVDKSAKLMGQLRTFAATTPFEMEGITDATKKLLAFGFAQDDVIPQLGRLGDIGSAIGVPLGELAEIYGKARVQGRLFAEDVNQLTGRGIPVIQQFAKQFGVTDSEVRKLVESGKIGFKQLEQAIIDMTKAGSMFGGGMERQSKTLAGQWSTVKDQIKEINNDLMAGTLPAIKALVEGTAEIAKNFAAWMQGPEARRGKPVEEQLKAITDEIAALEAKRAKSIHRIPGGWAERTFGKDHFGVKLEELRKEESRLRQQVLDNQRKARAEADKQEKEKSDKARLDGIKAMVGAVLRPDKLLGGLKQGGGLLAELQKTLDEEWRKALASNLLKPPGKKAVEEVKQDVEKDNRRDERDPGGLSAVESRFLTRGSGSIDPALAEAKKNNRLAEKNLRELQEQNRHLRKLAGKRGLQPANLN